MAIESEAKNLMGTIRKYKEKRKRKSEINSSDDEDLENTENSSQKCEESKKKHKHKASTSLEKIGFLEKEIKQICSRIGSLNQCLHDENNSDEEIDI